MYIYIAMHVYVCVCVCVCAYPKPQVWEADARKKTHVKRRQRRLGIFSPVNEASQQAIGGGGKKREETRTEGVTGEGIFSFFFFFLTCRCRCCPRLRRHRYNH